MGATGEELQLVIELGIGDGAQGMGAGDESWSGANQRGISLGINNPVGGEEPALFGGGGDEEVIDGGAGGAIGPRDYTGDGAGAVAVDGECSAAG